MKKLLLSAMVLVSLALYSYQRSHDETTAVKPPVLAAGPSQSKPATNASGTPPADSTPAQPASAYKDGSFTGSLANAYYGYVQVMAIVKGGQLTNVQFLRYPNDHRNSIEINRQAMPYLSQEAIQAQNADVDIVTGATDTSYAFRESLASALAEAKS